MTVTEVLVGKSVSVPSFSPQVPNGLTSSRNRASAASDQSHGVVTRFDVTLVNVFLQLVDNTVHKAAKYIFGKVSRKVCS
jgi:hypothetical protein